MTTKICYVINRTNETIRFQRLEQWVHDCTIAPGKIDEVNVDIPWCLSGGHADAQRYIKVSLLHSRKFILIWESRGAIYAQPHYSDPASAIAGDASTEEDKVLVVSHRGVSLHDKRTFQMAETVGYHAIDDSTPPEEALDDQAFDAQDFLSEAEEGEDDLHPAQTGYCRIYVRRSSAFGFGHVGFAFSNPDGTWTVGAVENPKGTPITNVGETGLWSKIVDPSQVSASFTTKHPMNYPYDAYKSLPVGNADFHAARQVLAGWYQNKYLLIGQTCMDATYEILDAFHAPLPPEMARPNAWFDTINAKSYSVRPRLERNPVVEGCLHPVPTDVSAMLDTVGAEDSSSAVRTITPEEPIGDAAASGWFNTAAIPVAGLPHPPTKSNGWSRVHFRGRLPQNTRLFLHSWAGINVLVPQNHEAEQPAAEVPEDPTAQAIEWITLFTGVVTFIKFLSDTIIHVGKTWVEFSDWYAGRDGASAGEAKGSARRVHVPDAKQDQARRQVPNTLVPRRPKDDGSNAGDGATEDLGAFGYTQGPGGHLISTRNTRGLQIVLRYSKASGLGDRYMRLPWNARQAMVLSENQLGSVPAIHVDQPEEIESVFVGWLEHPDDWNRGQVSSGDMFGVLDFWVHS